MTKYHNPAKPGKVFNSKAEALAKPTPKLKVKAPKIKED